MNANSSSRRVAPQKRDSQSLRLATALRIRRVQLLRMTIKEAAELAGLEPEQWSALESGWIPAMGDRLWIWFTLAGTLQVTVDKLFHLAGDDLARRSVFSRKRDAA